MDDASAEDIRRFNKDIRETAAAYRTIENAASRGADIGFDPINERDFDDWWVKAIKDKRLSKSERRRLLHLREKTLTRRGQQTLVIIKNETERLNHMADETRGPELEAPKPVINQQFNIMPPPPAIAKEGSGLERLRKGLTDAKCDSERHSGGDSGGHLDGGNGHSGNNGADAT